MILPEKLTDPTGGVWLLRRAWPRFSHGSSKPCLTHTIVEMTSSDEPDCRHAAILHGDGKAQPFTLTAHPYGVDPALPTLNEHLQQAYRQDSSATVIVHRWGKRAVIRSAQGFIKIVKAGKAPKLVDKQRDVIAHYGRHVVLAEIIHSDDSSLVTAPLAGQTLAQLGASSALSDSALAEHWQQFGQVMGACHRDRLSIKPALPEYVLDDEYQVVSAGLTSMVLSELLTPCQLDKLRQQSEQLFQQLRRLTCENLSVLHRDLHDKQVLFTPAGLALLDFDTASLGDPALDLGNVLAHLRLRAYQQAWLHPTTEWLSFARFKQAQQAFLNGWSPEEDLIKRAHIYAELSWIRLLGVYLWRPAWQKMIHKIIRDIEHHKL